MTRVPSAGLARLLRITSRIEDGILIVLLLTMIGLAGAQILLRNIFDASLLWADPLLRILVLWVGLAGAVVATRMDNHIAVGVLPPLLPPRAKIGVRVIVDLFTCLVSAVLAYHSARFVLMEREYGTIALGAVPAWICELILPVGFGVIALRYLAYAVAHGKQFIARERPT